MLSSAHNVKEHAPLSAGASVDHGGEVQTKEEHENREADRGCCVSTCCASSGCDFGPNGDRALTPDEKMEYARRADERDWLLRSRMWVESVEDIDDGPIVL